jgi:preprotein translocase subunit SecA
MDHLKEVIGLRGYGQHDPLVEYKRESFDMFEAMMRRFEEDTVRYLYLMQIIGPEGRPIDVAAVQRRGPDPGDFPGHHDLGGSPPDLLGGDGSGVRQPVGGGDGGNGHGHPSKRAQTSVDDLEEAFLRKKKKELQQARMAGSGDMAPVQQVKRSGDKVGRNDPCPCGSGKKYKKCCGANS